nr:immunoglobulin heavy chain junction region [Homo sapiens]
TVSANEQPENRGHGR